MSHRSGSTTCSRARRDSESRCTQPGHGDPANAAVRAWRRHLRRDRSRRTAEVAVGHAHGPRHAKARSLGDVTPSMLVASRRLERTPRRLVGTWKLGQEVGIGESDTGAADAHAGQLAGREQFVELRARQTDDLRGLDDGDEACRWQTRRSSWRWLPMKHALSRYGYSVSAQALCLTSCAMRWCEMPRNRAASR